MVNRSGRQILRSPDPLERIEAVHLAAQAPRLLDLVERLARRLECWFATESTRPKLDRWLIEEAKDVRFDCLAPCDEVLAIVRSGRPLEIQLEQPDFLSQETSVA